jgi:hypothetical protein
MFLDMQKSRRPDGRRDWIRRKTTTRYAGAPEKVLLMPRKIKPPMIEW